MQSPIPPPTAAPLAAPIRAPLPRSLLLDVAAPTAAPPRAPIMLPLVALEVFSSPVYGSYVIQPLIPTVATAKARIVFFMVFSCVGFYCGPARSGAGHFIPRMFQ